MTQYTPPCVVVYSGKPRAHASADLLIVLMYKTYQFALVALLPLQWGRHPDLLAAAGLQAPRQAAAFAASLGAHLHEAVLQPLQIMLDTFPPSATSELIVEVC